VRWRLYAGLAVVAAASIAAIVIALASVSGADELEHVKSAFRLQTNCTHIAVTRPSRALSVRRWTGLTAQSADVDCTASPLRVSYAKFIDRTSMNRAVAAGQPAGGYCLLSDSIVSDERADVASTVLSDMCQSLGGKLLPG